MASDLAIGVDLGGSHVKAAVVDSSGSIVRAKTVAVADLAFDRVTQAIAAAVQEVSGGDAGTGAVGVGSPGNVNLETGAVRYSPNFFWNDVPLRERLRALLGRDDVFVANDARCATLGEYRFGAGKGTSDFALLTLGTGIGGGIVSAGRFVLGARWAAAEVGHHQIRAHDGFACNCGKTGCFEAQASATGLLRHTLSLRPSFPFSSLAEPPLDAKKVIDAAIAGDTHALAAWKRYLDDLAIGVANVIAFVNPELIALGGGVSNAGDALLVPLRPKVDALTVMAPRGTTKIIAATLANDAGLIGAAEVARQGGFEQS